MNLSFKQTQKSCVNNSPSKQLFSFSKSSRFKYKTQASISNSRLIMPESSFDIKNKKGPSFPKVVKKLIFPFEKQRSKLPSSNQYNIQSSIQFNKAHKIGIVINKKTIQIKKQIKSNLPSPFTYNPKQNGISSRSSSFNRSKKQFDFPLQLKKGRQSPGPAYLIDVKKLQTKIGKFQNKNSMCQYFPQNSPRIKHHKSHHILPFNNQSKAKYKQFKVNLQKLQNHNKSMQLNLNRSKLSSLETTHKKSKIVVFGKAERKSIFENKQDKSKPGPGKYQKISQFAKLQKKLYVQNKKKKKVNFFLIKTANGKTTSSVITKTKII